MTVIRRQRRAKERKVATAFKLDRSLLDKLAEFAEARGQSAASVVSTALLAYLNEPAAQPPQPFKRGDVAPAGACADADWDESEVEKYLDALRASLAKKTPNTD